MSNSHYLDVPEDVICDIKIGRNKNPSFMLARKIIELHRSIKPDLYKAIVPQSRPVHTSLMIEKFSTFKKINTEIRLKGIICLPRGLTIFYTQSFLNAIRQPQRTINILNLVGKSTTRAFEKIMRNEDKDHEDDLISSLRGMGREFFTFQASDDQEGKIIVRMWPMPVVSIQQAPRIGINPYVKRADIVLYFGDNVDIQDAFLKTRKRTSAEQKATVKHFAIVYQNHIYQDRSIDLIPCIDHEEMVKSPQMVCRDTDTVSIKDQIISIIKTLLTSKLQLATW